MSYIDVRNLSKTFMIRKKREKGRLLREKTEVKALQDMTAEGRYPDSLWG